MKKLFLLLVLTIGVSEFTEAKEVNEIKVEEMQQWYALTATTGRDVTGQSYGIGIEVLSYGPGYGPREVKVRGSRVSFGAVPGQNGVYTFRYSGSQYYFRF